MDPFSRQSRMLTALLLVAAAAQGEILSSLAVVNVGCQKYSNSLTCDYSDLVDLNEVKRWNIHDVVNLSAAHNHITHLDPGTLSNATNLTTLVLHHNAITNVDIDSLCSMEKLKHLDLSFNRLSEFYLPKDCKFSLSTLNISNNALNRFFVAPEAGYTLTHLNLEKNFLQNNIDFLSNLPALKILILGSNGISDIGSEIFSGTYNKFYYLHYLYLNNNKITDVAFLKNLTILYYLNLSNNNISLIHDNLASSLLVELNLSFNAIEDVSFLGYLMNKTKLKILDMSHNRIHYINPTYFAGNKILLTSLDVSHNDLESVSFVRNIRTLTSFRADFNRISYINVTDISKQGKSTIINLSLSHNEIPEIKFLTGLQQLRELNVSYNSITETRNSFHYTKELISLDISHNNLSEFESTSHAVNFTFLNISHNKLHRIPCSESLEYLNLDENILTDLDISCLPNLRRLSALEVVIENRLGYRLQEAWVIDMKTTNSVTKCRPPKSSEMTCKEACKVMGEDSLLCSKSATRLIAYSAISICVIICVAFMCIGVTFYRGRAKNNAILECTCIGQSNPQYQYVRAVNDFRD